VLHDESVGLVIRLYCDDDLLEQAELIYFCRWKAVSTGAVIQTYHF
jgi:hypothetical protein